jgi:hypothetical protein
VTLGGKVSPKTQAASVPVKSHLHKPKNHDPSPNRTPRRYPNQRKGCRVQTENKCNKLVSILMAQADTIKHC